MVLLAQFSLKTTACFTPNSNQRKMPSIDYCGSVEKNVLNPKSFNDQNNAIDAIYNELLCLLNFEAVISEGNWSVATDQRENLFKNRLVENVSNIQLIAFFFAAFPSRVVQVVSFFVAFSKRIPLASQTFYSYCLRIQTPFQFAIFFILFVSVNSSENRRQLLCFKQAKDLKKIFAGIRNAMNENIIQSAESEIHSREAQMVMQELF